MLRDAREQAREEGVMLPKGLTAIKTSAKRQYFVEGRGGTVRMYVKAHCSYLAKAIAIMQIIKEELRKKKP